MLDALIIFSREGFEAFLIVAIITTYLRKSGRQQLLSSVYWGIAVAVVISIGVGYLLRSVGLSPLWEGMLGLAAAATVISLVVHMWKVAPRLKGKMEAHLNEVTSSGSKFGAVVGVFAFTMFMISREGIESAVMLYQISDKDYIIGILLGLVVAAVISWAWGRFGHRVNISRFFQVTGIYLILFAVQMIFTASHEFAEAQQFGSFSATWHEWTEPYSTSGVYGRWFSLIVLGICALWFVGSVIWKRLQTQQTKNAMLDTAVN